MIYWRVLYATIVTWIFAVIAAANGAGVGFFAESCDVLTDTFGGGLWGDDDFSTTWEEACNIGEYRKGVAETMDLVVLWCLCD